MTNPDAPARLPVLFLAHGNPMNAVEDNAFTRALGRLAAELPARGDRTGADVHALRPPGSAAPASGDA
jgi:hypothetical protein